MKGLVLILGIVLATGCGRSSMPGSQHAGSGSPYFEFDELHHYFASIDESEVFPSSENEEIRPENKALIAIAVGDEPLSIQGTTFIDMMEQAGYVRKIVAQQHFEAINDIFMEKSHDDWIGTTCIPIYRDILVFSKADQVTGIAKICFECSKHQIIGTTANTEYFGQSGDYRKLAQILH
jgi:hypothetical protein